MICNLLPWMQNERGFTDKATPSISTSITITILSRVGFVTAMSTATTKCAAHVSSKVLSGGGAEA